MSCRTKLLKLICVFVLIFVGVLLGPNSLPESAKFTEFKVTPFKSYGKNAATNELLNKAERLFEGEIKGPEGFEIVNGELYTTLHGGYVAKIFDDQVVPVVKFGQPCEGWWEESKCGRPLGMKAFRKDNIIVADAYYGIFMYNVKSFKVTTLVDKDTVIDGQKPKIFNAVDVASDGTIYWTHSSSDFLLEDAILTYLADGSGRLIKYDPVTKKNTVLMKGLQFANGLILSPNEDFVLVAESAQSRIHRYYLKGPKKFTNEIFMDGLPGSPDNLRQNGEGGFFINFPVVTNEQPFVYHVIAPFPTLRRFFAQFLSLVKISFEKIHHLYPSYLTKRAIHYVGHFESLGMFLPIISTIFEVDSNGNVIRSYHATNGSVSHICDEIIHNGYMYLGSPFNEYLGRIKLSEFGSDHTFNRPKRSAPSLNEPTNVRPSATITTRLPPTATTRLSSSSTSTRSPPTTTKPPPPSGAKSVSSPPPPTASTGSRPTTKSPTRPSAPRINSKPAT